MLLTNCKKDCLKDLKRTVCVWSSHANTFRKLVFQKSYFYSNIMIKILQWQKNLNRKIIGGLVYVQQLPLHKITTSIGASNG